MPACSPAAPGASLKRAFDELDHDARASLGASCAAMVAGGAMLTASVPTFVAGTWLLLAAGCTLVDSVGARRAPKERPALPEPDPPSSTR
jgi:hypothetical protein